jgi:hypothetical protein
MVAAPPEACVAACFGLAGDPRGGSVSAVGTRPSAGDFRGEENCVCGFMVDEYDGGHSFYYADPDTGRVIDRCPDCGRDLTLTRARRSGRVDRRSA